MQLIQHEQMAPPRPESALDALRAAYREFNSGGDVPLEMFHDDVIYEQPELMIGTGAYIGHDGLRQALRDMLSSFETFEMHPTDLVYEGGENFVLRVRIRARGKGSGAPVDGRIYHVWTFRGDRVARGRVFLDRSEAIDAALAETRLPAAA